MTIEGLLIKCTTEEVPCGFFLRTVIVNRGNSYELKPKENVLVLRQWADLYQFSTKPRMTYKFFTFAIQRRLLELLSYGEYNHLFISVTCFLKKTHLSVIVVSNSFFFSHFQKKCPHIDYSNIVLKTMNDINLNNFSLGDPCCEINFGKTKSLKIARNFCAKVFLRIISIKLFVIWQV